MTRELFGIRLEIEVETDVFGEFFVEVGFDSAIDFGGEFGNAFRGWAIFAVGRVVFGISEDERNDVADFALDAGTVAILLSSSAGVDSGGVLELAEGFGDSAIATTENPVDDFAFTHDVEVVRCEVTTDDHRVNNIGDELESSTRFVAIIDAEERKGSLDELDTTFGGLETDFVESVFVFEDGEVLVEGLNLVEGPGIEKEETITKGIFEPVGSQTRGVIVGDRVDMIIGNFARENIVTFELLHDDAGVTNGLFGLGFDRFLVFGITVHIVDTMFEGRRGNIVKEASESLAFILRKMPDNESDANAVTEDVVKAGELEEAIVIDTDHTDSLETLEFGGGNIFEEPGWEVGGENFEILTRFGREALETFFLAGQNIEHAVVAVEETITVRRGVGVFALDRRELARWLDGGKRRCGSRGSGADFDGGGEFDGGAFVRNGDSSLLARRAAIDFEPILIKPEFDFVIAAEFFGRHLQEVNLDFAAAIEVADDSVGEFGESARADVARNAVFVFVHDKESIGLVEVFVELLIKLRHTFGVIGIAGADNLAEGEARSRRSFGEEILVLKKRARPVDYFIATTFEIASPVESTLVQFRTTRNNKFFH